LFVARAKAFAVGWETFHLGLKNLRLHKLRSFLTALGIIFGVGAVICMLSISEGASASEMELIRLLGTQNIIVKSVKPNRGGAVSQGNTRILEYGITEEDRRLIENTVPYVGKVVPLREVAYRVSRGDRQYGAPVVGSDSDFFVAVNVPVSRGRRLTQYDEDVRAKVCVIGDDIRKQLFTHEDPIGQTLTVHNRASGPIPFKVVGVMRPVLTAGSPARGIGERNLNGDVFIPFRTADARYGSTVYNLTSGSRELTKVAYSDLYVHVPDMERVLPVSEMISRVMERGHEKQDYEVKVPLERLRLAEKEKANRQITLGAIAGVSLLVGGIGIMNIMLASVTERTNEIGIRRALGARQVHIVQQFLVETVVLSTAGGLIGILLGWVGALIISRSVGWPTIVQPWTVGVSFGLSVIVGVFFGMYPAITAARLDPIEAVRHE
jgi:putative ABC transport system permease protein